jgi:hypothetical protein
VVRAENQIISKVNVSMVSLKWGDVLSTLFPGIVVLFAISPYFPSLHEKILKIDQTSATFGVVLLIGACLAGGVLGAITRILWEPFWLVKRCSVPHGVMKNITSENKDLYERLVENSYKYVTFYANLAWAVIILFCTRIQQGGRLFSGAALILTLTIIILIRASHVQWSYYVKSMKQFYSEESQHAEKRTAAGNQS